MRCTSQHVDQESGILLGIIFSVLDFLFGSPVLSVALAICSILGLKTAISAACCNSLEFEPLIFRDMCNMLVLDGARTVHVAWYFAPRIHLGLVWGWFI